MLVLLLLPLLLRMSTARAFKPIEILNLGSIFYAIHFNDVTAAVVANVAVAAPVADCVKGLHMQTYLNLKFGVKI